MILVTGGSGLLGTHLKELLPDALFPTHGEFDIMSFNRMREYALEKGVQTIVHCAAFTSPPKVNERPIDAMQTNIVGTANVVRLAELLKARLIYISTDYVFDGVVGDYCEDDAVNPVNKYAWSKLGGECCVRMYEKSLIVRLSFGPSPFPYPKAFVDQFTSREPVKVTAKKLAKIIASPYCGILHVGAPKQSVFDYAKSLSPVRAVEPISVNDVNFTIPTDTSLDTSLYEKHFGAL